MIAKLIQRLATGCTIGCSGFDSGGSWELFCSILCPDQV